MISIKPEWVALILNGTKTIEIRKTMPKCELPIKCYIYCTKQGRPLVYGDVPCNSGFIEKYTQTYNYSKEDVDKIWGNLQGKVVAEFTLKSFYEIDLEEPKDKVFIPDYRRYIDHLEARSCLHYESLYTYLDPKTKGYGWEIDNLKIYDTPKELNKFKKYIDDCPCNKGKYCEYMYYDYEENCDACSIDFDGSNCFYKKLTKAPQSWCYVEEIQDE